MKVNNKSVGFVKLTSANHWWTNEKCENAQSVNIYLITLLVMFNLDKASNSIVRLFLQECMWKVLLQFWRAHWLRVSKLTHTVVGGGRLLYCRRVLRVPATLLGSSLLQGTLGSERCCDPVRVVPGLLPGVVFRRRKLHKQAVWVIVDTAHLILLLLSQILRCDLYLFSRECSI